MNWSRAFVMTGAAFLIVAAPNAPASAGLSKGSQTVDDLTIYLGVVPAALTRGRAAEHTHAAEPGKSLHNIHLVAAIFDKTSGRRLRLGSVTARVQPRGGEAWDVPLRPMTVNDALTYGGYTSMGVYETATIFIEVRRASRSKRPRLSIAQFEYEHD